MPEPDFIKMSDDELESFIVSFPSRFDIQGAVFEHQRRQAVRRKQVESLHHQKIHRLNWWTLLVSIAAALFAGIAALDVVLRWIRGH